MNTIISPIYTDYLFALYLNGKPVSVETLFEESEPDSNGDTAFESSDRIIKSMEDNGLIEVSSAGETQYIGLTDLGREMSVMAADIISEKMLSEWQKSDLPLNQEDDLPETA